MWGSGDGAGLGDVGPEMSNRIFEEIKILCRGEGLVLALRWADTRDREWKKKSEKCTQELCMNPG